MTLDSEVNVCVTGLLNDHTVQGFCSRDKAELPNLDSIRHRNALEEIIRKLCPRKEAVRIREQAERIWSFAKEIMAGDLVAMPTRGWSGMALGRLTGPYMHRPDLPVLGRHTRAVNWLGEFRARAFEKEMRCSPGLEVSIRKLSVTSQKRAAALIEKNQSVGRNYNFDTDSTLFRFDVSDYAYLNNAPKKQWIAECLARNSELRRDYSEWERKGHEHEQLQAIQTKYGVNVRSGWHPGIWVGGNGLIVELPPAVGAFRFVPTEEKELEKSLRARQRKLLHRKNPQWDDVLNLLQYGGQDIQPFDLVRNLVAPLAEKPLKDLPDTLFLAIRMNRPSAEIKRELDRVMGFHSKRSRPKRVPIETKYYLMVLDLKERYPEEGRRDRYHFVRSNPRQTRAPPETNLRELENVSNYLAKARRLIKGEYKKYTIGGRGGGF